MSPTTHVLCVACKQNAPTLPEYDQLCDTCRNGTVETPEQRAYWEAEIAAAKERDRIAGRVRLARDTPGCRRCRLEPVGASAMGLRCARCGYVTDKKREFGW